MFIERRLYELTPNDRVRILRKTLGLSQESFGEKLGMKKSSISTIEKGTNNLTDIVAKLICATFNVDYFWLTEGADVDMFTAFPETILDEVVEEFKLDKEDRALLETYLEASKEERKILLSFFQTFAKKVQQKDED